MLTSIGNDLVMVNLTQVKMATFRVDGSVELRIDDETGVNFTDPDTADMVTAALAKECSETVFRKSPSETLAGFRDRKTPSD